MLFLKIALRNLFRQRRRSFLTGLTMIVGFTLLSLSFGLAEGSYGGVIKIFTEARTGHVQIHADGYRKRPNLHKTLKVSKDLELSPFSFIKGWTSRVYSSALAYGNNKAIGTRVIGVDSIRETQTTRFTERISKGKLSPDGALISYALSRQLKLAIGDPIVLISEGADGSIANDVFPVTGIIGSKDDPEKTLECYLTLENAQEFFALGERVHEVVIMTDSYKKAPLYSNEIRDLHDASSLDIQPWQVVEKGFYEAMLADIKGMYISLGIITLIIALGVLNSVLMTLMERSREYGLFKALGTGPGELFTLIILEVQLLSFFSIIIGGALSFFLNRYLTLYGLPLPEPIQFGGISFSTYYSVMSPEVYWIPSVMILLTSFIVSIFPAWRVVKSPPVKSLQPII